MGRRAVTPAVSAVASRAGGKGTGRKMGPKKTAAKPSAAGLRSPREGGGRGGRKLSRMERGINEALLVTVNEACGILCLSRREMYRLMGRGEIEFRQVGRFRRIPVWSLEDFAGVPERRRRQAVGAA